MSESSGSWLEFVPFGTSKLGFWRDHGILLKGDLPNSLITAGSADPSLPRKVRPRCLGMWASRGSRRKNIGARPWMPKPHSSVEPQPLSLVGAMAVSQEIITAGIFAVSGIRICLARHGCAFTHFCFE